MGTQRKKISILGSTGSIGTQTLDVVADHTDRFEVRALVAGSNWKLLAEQARQFHPELVVIGSEEAYSPLRESLEGTGIRVLSGPEAIVEAATLPEVDMVVAAMVGYSGLLPTLRAVEAGKTIALANKETLVAGGELITGAARKSGSMILPVDSEHSAIFQCLAGEAPESVEKILLTASGGPFRHHTKEQLEEVTAADALRHPNWDMGAKVTIDSASMMNKGFEMIEARWLFGVPPERIEVVVHPQSIVHSMVQFRDGSVKAQLGLPDMHLPISHALSWPERLPGAEKPLSLHDYARLEFEAPDFERFPLLGYAFEAIAAGGTAPCVLNAANEIAVAAFLKGRLKFTDMPRLVRRVMDDLPPIEAKDLAVIEATDHEARTLAHRLLQNSF